MRKEEGEGRERRGQRKARGQNRCCVTGVSGCPRTYGTNVNMKVPIAPVQSSARDCQLHSLSQP